MRKKDDEKKQNIKEAVIKLILEQGFHGASISKIAREAGVSPATVYIYYENKEDMLRDIYQEYGEQVYSYILNEIDREMSGRQLIETLIRSYYKFIKEHEEIFSFVEQYSSCPALVNNCQDIEGCSQIFNLLDDLKEHQVIKDVDNVIMFSLLFYPVKCITVKYFNQPDEAEAVLTELIGLIQETLLDSDQQGID